MDYEKKLKEALVNGNADYEVVRWIEQTFPELKESEDERIREKIIATIHLYYGEPLEDEAKEMIAWLEKHGEQKPVFEMKTPEESLGIDSDTYNKIVDDCVYGEQKLVEFKPSFRVGDVIKPKDHVLGEPRIVKGIHPKFGYDTNNGILDFEFEDNWELVEQKPADKVEPKFHEGDKIRRKTPSSCDRDMQVARIEKDYYICNHIGKFSSEVVPFSKESSYELVEHKPVVSLDENGEPILTPFEAELFSMMSDAWQNYSLGEEVNIAKIVKEHSEELLERANEQKHADTVKPKFKVGDRVIGIVSGMQYYITEICDDYYNTESGCTIMFYAQDNYELVEQNHAGADLKDIVDKEANAIWKEINTGGSHSIIDSFNQFYGICMQVAEAVVDYLKLKELKAQKGE